MLHDVFEELVSDPEADWFEQYPELVGISIGWKEKDGRTLDYPCLLFEVEEKLFNPVRLLPKSISANGITIPTDVIAVGKTQPAFHRSIATQPLEDDAALPASPMAVSRLKEKIEGTLGARVFRKKGEQDQHFVLGCYHVLCAPELRQGKLTVEPSPGTAHIVSPGTFTDSHSTPIGSVTKGMLDGGKGLDVALAEINHEHAIFQPQPDPQTFAQLSRQDRDGKYRIRSRGRQSWDDTSFLNNFFVPQRISYPHDDVVVRDLIEVDRLVKPGDSGAVAVNSKNELVGIIVATNRRFSYLMPIDRVLTALEVGLWPPEGTNG